MKVLLIKTSSLGDVLHTLPAITDAVRHVDGLQFDWVVEEAFAEIPGWHRAVQQVIPVALRRWRRSPITAMKSGEWKQFRRDIRQTRYDLVIDAQGLMKSAFIASLTRGRRVGLDRHSAREPLASLAYQQSVYVRKGQHAIERTRQLFARAFGYEDDVKLPDYQIRGQIQDQSSAKVAANTLVFLHGTTWDTKLWPLDYWRKLAAIVTSAGYEVSLPWGNEQELRQARQIAADQQGVSVLPQMNLLEVANVLADAKGAVAVDSGIGHLAAALEVPAVSLYGATNSGLTGTRGKHQSHINAVFECAPCLSRKCLYKGETQVTPACYASITPEDVWETLLGTMGSEVIRE
ncbi:MAG: lipopolysaccharide heptosyltransferase I [Gammaproteobacteria bacterium]|nr:MAG: lipopolysaccharide heptosyltransferase I [Gammaproteobacteria bacterium]